MFQKSRQFMTIGKRVDENREEGKGNNVDGEERSKRRGEERVGK